MCSSADTAGRRAACSWSSRRVNAADFGDEPLLIARRLGVPVIVGESRYAAGRVAEQKFQSQLHILDDGFQHRSLHRDFDIVLMTERDFGDQHVAFGAPARTALLARARGRDRAARRRCGAIIGRCGKSRCGELRASSFSRACLPHPSCSAALRGPGSFLPRYVPLESGRRRKSSFAITIAMIEVTSSACLQCAQKSRARGFLTTEKDAVNLGSLQREARSAGESSRLGITVDDPTDVVDAILARISEREGPLVRKS